MGECVGCICEGRGKVSGVEGVKRCWVCNSCGGGEVVRPVSSWYSLAS